MSRPSAADVMVVLVLLVAGCGPSRPQHAAVSDDGDVIRISRAEAEDGSVHFYTYRVGGSNVDFLVRRDAAGGLHVHLDACYSCYHYKRGYVVEDGKLVCIACRLEYPIAQQAWDFIGPCAPIPIHSELDRDSIIIERSLLVKATRYF